MFIVLANVGLVVVLVLRRFTTTLQARCLALYSASLKAANVSPASTATLKTGLVEAAGVIYAGLDSRLQPEQPPPACQPLPLLCKPLHCLPLAIV